MGSNVPHPSPCTGTLDLLEHDKLGLRGFENTGLLEQTKARPARVTLPLRQHTGTPARPVVTNGARAQRGDLIAQPADGALGARLHASMSGICTVHDDCITIHAS